jgi:hypothetical protein
VHEQVVELIEVTAVRVVGVRDGQDLVVRGIEAPAEAPEELRHRQVDLTVPGVHGGVEDHRGAGLVGVGVAAPEVAVEQRGRQMLQVRERLGHEAEETVEDLP